MQLFYDPNLKSGSKTFIFSKEEAKHVLKVLRKKVGDSIQITNGKGLLFEAEIIVADTKNCMSTIIRETTTERPPHQLHLAVAPTKMNDRYQWFLEKATEIGVTTITPILCEHSERKIIKTERYEKIIQAAMKQSLQTYLPKLNPLTPFAAFIKNEEKASKFIAHCAGGDKSELLQLAPSRTAILVLIGPEGDFSNQEIELALQHGFVPVSLGKNRLRTETAAIMACSTIALKNA